MPVPANTDAVVIGDVIQEAITELTAAASILETKQPGRHAARMVTTVNFNVDQLSAILPAVRQMSRLDPTD